MSTTDKDPEGSAQEQAAALKKLFRDPTTSPMALSRAIQDYQKTHSVTSNEVARRIGSTPSTVHGYKTLATKLARELGPKVDSGQLSYKEARAIADIPDHRRQLEIAAPFIDGRLSSVYVERFARLAQSSPGRAVDQLIHEVLGGTPVSEPEHRADPAPQPALARASYSGADELDKNVLRIAGELDALRLQTIPEYRRLELALRLRVLDSRLHAALAHLNGTNRELSLRQANPPSKAAPKV